MSVQNSDAPVYSIGSVARELGVSVHTLRVYEREGLIVPARSSGNQRTYSRDDIDRLACIRKAINEEKISIAGIRRIHAFIPCWQIIGCSERERDVCPAYMNHDGGCWTFVHRKNQCTKRECRTCIVYKGSMECGRVKELLKNALNERQKTRDKRQKNEGKR